jgi:hypothetical protein
MNGPHKFGTEFGSDNAPEHSAAIVAQHFERHAGADRKSGLLQPLAGLRAERMAGSMLAVPEFHSTKSVRSCSPKR